jgi:hypothetical protein
MKKYTLLLVFLLSFFSLKAMGQVTDMPDVVAKYVVSDNLLKKKFTEIWTYHPIPSPDDSMAYELNKQSVSKEIRLKETKSEYYKLVVLTDRKGRHFKERFSQDPGDLEGGENAYGYVEVWDTENEHLIESWPAFVQVKALTEEIQEATFQIYMSGGLLLTIVKTYDSRYYPLPFTENQKITQGGVVKEDFTFTMQD